MMRNKTYFKFGFLVFILMAASCIAPKQFIPPPPEAEFESVSTAPRDQNTIEVSGILVLSGLHPERKTTVTTSLHFMSDSNDLGTREICAETCPSKEGLARIPFLFDISVRECFAETNFKPGARELPYSLHATIRATDIADPFITETKGSFPMVRDPVLKITSIKIGRDILVTTKLYLTMEIRNPNPFTVTLEEISYRFYGEGRHWTAGSTDETFAAEALETVSVTLPIEMNFTTMGRNVFDLVARLKSVQYRLEGTGTIRTDLRTLPKFRMSFDLTGNSEVIR